MFVKELQLYLTYLSNKIDEIKEAPTKQQQKYITTFSKNLQQGIDYYLDLSEQLKNKYKEGFEQIEKEMNLQKNSMNELRARFALM